MKLIDKITDFRIVKVLSNGSLVFSDSRLLVDEQYAFNIKDHLDFHKPTKLTDPKQKIHISYKNRYFKD